MSRAVAQPLRLRDFRGPWEEQSVMIASDTPQKKKTSPGNKWCGWHRLRRLILQRYLEGPTFWLINVGTKKKKRAVVRVWKPEINTEIRYNMLSKTFLIFQYVIYMSAFEVRHHAPGRLWGKVTFEVSFKWLLTLLRCISHVTILKVLCVRFRGRHGIWYS